MNVKSAAPAIFSLPPTRNELPLDLKTLHQFTAIYLTDSSTMALPDTLKVG